MKERIKKFIARRLLWLGDCAFNLAVHLFGWRQVQVPGLGLRWRKTTGQQTLTYFRENAVSLVRQYVNNKPSAK